MLKLENEGRNYHLVGHSHGGSVIWEALVSAEVTRNHGKVYAELRRALNDPEVLSGGQPLIPPRRDEYDPWWVRYKTRDLPDSAEYEAIRSAIKLQGLRSWTTVGTPFMRYMPVRRGLLSRCLSLQSSSAWRILGKEYVALIPMLLTALPLVPLAAALFGWNWGRAVLTSDTANAWSVPYLLCWLVTFRSMRVSDYSDSLLVRERAVPGVFRRFSGRWLGLWSPSDEAINMLSSLAHHQVRYELLWSSGTLSARRKLARLPNQVPLPNLTIPDPIRTITLVPHVRRTSVLSATKPVVNLVNRCIAPLWTRKLARTLARSVQGSDLPRTVAAYVSPWPLPLDHDCTHLGLPVRTIREIDREVTDCNAMLAPKARELLIIAALKGAPKDGQGSGRFLMESGSALVHTGYFNNPDVRRLILHHICQTRTSVDGYSAPADDELEIWLTRHLESTRTCFAGLLQQSIEALRADTFPVDDSAR
ncbi:hypothetical protein ACWDX8_04820 [Streptomyces anthocyanicus]